ncbi:MAG: hypothetical protein GF372_06130, partial [Candidatus Marinimicrobia bacterium]|nr:hypothetical protein [Candidatus Neomarinimicrobiota bacterium]
MNNRKLLRLWIFFVTISVVFNGCSNNRSNNSYPDLPSLQSPITTYYSPGAESQAQAIQGMLREAAEYYEANLGVEADISAAVADASHWSEITNVPYGLPGVTGSPPLVYFPADNDHELFKLLLSAIQNSELPACLLLPPDSLAQQFVRLIGFHELGHVYASAYGLNRPNKWVYELQASYLAYAYLRERHPEMASLWQQTSSLLANQIKPAHTTLADFEEMYVRVGIENYSWYQS